MKVRKLAVALALAGGLGSGVAHALGLGEIELQSYLNEPMDAEIVLPQSQGIDPGDVFVNIAPERAYQRLGLERNQFLGKLRFDVTTGANGSLVVNVSSREPLREPYLNFLLELTWPSGRLMREYAVLVDPPVYAEDSGVSESVRAASSAPAAQSQSASSAESARRQARAEQSRSGDYRSDTFGPTGPSDTLWTIASSVRPDNSLSMQQVMLAMQDLNPDAFIGNNINRLKRGQVLRVPTADQIRSRSRAEATRTVAQQNQEFQQPKRTVDATAEQKPKSAGAGEVAATGDELKLLVAGDEGDRSETEGGSAGGDGQLAGGVDAGKAVAMEELESSRRENDELNSRVDDLQDQVQTLQRLLELKNNQLAEVQQGAAANDSTALDAQVTDGNSVAADQAENAADAAVDPTADAGQEDITDSEATAGEPEVAEEPVDATAGLTEQADEQNGAAGEPDVAESEIEQPDTSVDEAGAAELGGTANMADEDAVNETPPDAEITGAATSEQPAKTDSNVEAEPEPKPQPKPVVERGFPGNVIDAITGNTIYQVALGGGLVLLLLILLLLARRSANREKEFYEQLNSETDGPEDDSFDLSLDDEPEQSGSSDALEEADAYMAYGRYDQAGEVLETAISREPSRTDLRLKLLGVYADNQDRESFEKQFGEIQTLDDEDAIEQASDLRARLEEAESMPSIDDLESQLRSGSFGEEADGSEDATSDEPEQVESEFSEFGSNETNFGLDALDETGQSTKVDAEADTGDDEEGENDDGLIEYDLSGLDLPNTKGETPEEAIEEESDFSSLEIDLDDPEVEEPLEDSFESSLEEPTEAEESLEDAFDSLENSSDFASDDTLESTSDTESTDFGALDESFLDELDAELDKVAGEDEELADSGKEESTLDDLELDVSDEDLALMEEFSDSENSTEPLEANLEDDELSLDDALSLDDELEPEDSSSEGDQEDLPVASDEVQDEPAKSPVADIDESDLGDDDDFDFLAGTDEAATKLDLARAYIEMGDSDGARDILEEVSLEGDDEQKAEAQDLLKNLS